MGRATAGLIALLLAGPVQAAELVPHDRVLLRGQVPLRIASDSSAVCALDLRFPGEPSEADALDAWAGELRGAFGDAGLTIETRAGASHAVRLSAPSPEFPAVIDALGRLLASSAAAAGHRAIALVCPGAQKPWIARLDAAFGRPRAVRRPRAPDVTASTPAPPTIRAGPPVFGFLWSVGELPEVEVRLALDLRRASVVRALADEEVEAAVEVATDFGRGRRDAALRVTFEEPAPAARPLFELLRAALVEPEEAPMDADRLDARWRAQRTATLRSVDSPLRRARSLGDREDWGADPTRELDAARDRSPRDTWQRARALAIDRAAWVVQHPEPPTHGELLGEPAARKNPLLQPSFDDEDE